MKFNSPSPTFAGAVKSALRTVGVRTVQPSISGLLLRVEGDTLTVEATDLINHATITATVNGEQDGTALVPALKLGDLMEFLAGAVTVEQHDDRVTITTGKRKTSLRTMPADEFPPTPATGPDAATSSLEHTVFTDLVGRVLPAAAKDASRPVLCAIQFAAVDGTMTFAATDSYRLAVSATGTDQADASAIVPTKALEEVRRNAAGPVSITLEEEQATFESGGYRLTTRLTQGDYPDWTTLLPAPDKVERRLTIDREKLLDAVRAAAVTGDGTAGARVTLHLAADNVAFSSQTADVGESADEIDGSLDGDPLDISFNSTYFTDGLRQVPTEDALIEFRGAGQPAVIRPSGEAQGDYRYLVMPLL